MVSNSFFHVLHSTSLLSHMLWQMFSSFHLYTWAKGKKLFSTLKSSTCFFPLIINDWPITGKNDQALDSPKIFILQSLPFGLLIEVTRVKFKAKGYDIKWGIIGNILQNTLGTWQTCWGTHWESEEHDGNLVRTTKNFKKSNTPQPPQKKKTGPLECMLAHLRCIHTWC